MKKNKNTTPAQEDKQPENLAYMNKGKLRWQLPAAFISGLLLALAFPPAGFSYLAWVALIPMLVIPMPKERLPRLLCGLIFGYTHFAMLLNWLNEVGFGAGWLLAIYCAIYPAAWYFLAGSLFKRLAPADELHPAAGLLHTAHTLRGCLAPLILAALWVALEWIRSWLFTGFPWGFTGISQYGHPSIIRLSAYTGVYGISFLIIMCNCTIAAELCRGAFTFTRIGKLCFPLHYVCFGICICLGLAPLFVQIPDVPEESPMLKVAAIQGNIPQCRSWTQQEYDFAAKTYDELTRKAVAEYDGLDLVLWPECAVPASMGYQPFMAMLIKLQQKTKIPLLMGAIQNRLPPGENAPELVRTFNSVLLLNEKAHVTAGYDKMHRVPFGEYVPFGDRLPWLRDAIGMGRDLTPGNTPYVFNLPKGARAGVNICFEDAFPEISRQFTLNGANVLMTVTNDSWYNESCGAEQHAAHVIFRAAENRRPFLRSGNNSHTMMITPAGVSMGQLVGPDSVFTSGFQAYELPVSDEWGLTFYTQHGDVFAHVCTLISAILLLIMLFFSYKKHEKLRKKHN